MMGQPGAHENQNVTLSSGTRICAKQCPTIAFPKLSAHGRSVRPVAAGLRAAAGPVWVVLGGAGWCWRGEQTGPVVLVGVPGERVFGPMVQ